MGEGELPFNGYRVSFGHDENNLGMDSGNGSIAL